MRFFASVAALSLILATSAFAQTASEQPAPSPAATPVEAAAPAAKPVADKKDGIICHKETPTGSHFPVKVCTTPEQRKAQHSLAQKAQESMQSAAPLVPQ